MGKGILKDPQPRPLLYTKLLTPPSDQLLWSLNTVLQFDTKLFRYQTISQVLHGYNAVNSNALSCHVLIDIKILVILLSK